MSNHLVCLLRRSKVWFGCESRNSRTERPVNGPPYSQSCVPVSVERVERQRRRRKHRRRIKQERRDLWVDHHPRCVHLARGNRHWLQSVWIATLQLWNKQRTSAFASSWRRSRVILIEKHFKPTCSKIMSTTHLVTIRKRWFVKWAM